MPSTDMTTTTFATLDPALLAQVTGGAGAPDITQIFSMISRGFGLAGDFFNSLQQLIAGFQGMFSAAQPGGDPGGAPGGPGAAPGGPGAAPRARQPAAPGAGAQ